MRYALPLLPLLLLVSCAAPSPGGPDHRDRWIAENPRSAWREAVLAREVRIGMPRDAMLAAWSVGTWSRSGEAVEGSGRTEWWRYETFIDRPGTERVERWVFRVALLGGVVTQAHGP